MIKNLLTFSLFIFISFICHSQEIIWPSYSEVEIPDSLLNENAIFISNVRTIGFNNVYQTNINVFKRILILSDNGAEELSHFTFYLSSDSKLERLGGRIIKENGKIITLNDGQLTKTFKLFKDEYSGRNKRLFQINYPSLEIGDVIDLMYDVKVDNYILSDNMYLEDNYASLSSRITLRNLSNFEINAYVINSDAQPNSKIVDGTAVLNWERQGVQKMNSTYFHAPDIKQQCLIYNLWDIGETLDYNAVYELDSKRYANDDLMRQEFEKYCIEKSIYLSSDPILVKIQKLITYLDKNMIMKENLPSLPAVKVLNNLKQNEFNEQSFFILMQKILKANKTKFWVGYSQNLLNGPFFNGIVSLAQLNTRFLIIEMPDSSQHYLFGPNNNRWYYLDEIPYYIEGNEAVTMTGNSSEIEKIAPIMLPQSTSQDNTLFVKLLVKKEGNTLNMRRDDHLSGHFSTILRSTDQSYWLHDFVLEQDSIDHFTQQNSYPYNLDVSTSEVTNFSITKNENNSTSISLKNMIPQHIYSAEEAEENELEGNVILPFEKQVKYSIYYQSDIPIKSLEKNDVTVINSVGEISYKSTLINENMILINLNLSITDRYLNTPQKIKDFEELLNQWTMVRQAKTTFFE